MGKLNLIEAIGRFQTIFLICTGVVVIALNLSQIIGWFLLIIGFIACLIETSEDEKKEGEK